MLNLTNHKYVYMRHESFMRIGVRVCVYFFSANYNFKWKIKSRLRFSPTNVRKSNKKQTNVAEYRETRQNKTKQRKESVFVDLYLLWCTKLNEPVQTHIFLFSNQFIYSNSRPFMFIAVLSIWIEHATIGKNRNWQQIKCFCRWFECVYRSFT